MPEIPDSIRHYYAAATLSADAVERCLTAARSVRRRHTLAWTALAATAVIAVAAWIGTGRNPSRTTLEDVEQRVSAFFERPDARLDFASADPTVVRQWVESHGGPRGFAIPPGLAGKPTAGCQILGEAKQRIFVVCFVSSDEGPDTATRVRIVHLAVIPKSAIADIPPLRSDIRIVKQHRWSYAAWSDEALVYVLLSEAGSEPLRQALKV